MTTFFSHCFNSSN